MKSFMPRLVALLSAFVFVFSSVALAASEDEGKLVYIEMYVDRNYDNIEIKLNDRNAIDDSRKYLSSGNSGGFYYRLFEIDEGDYEVSGPYYYKILENGTAALLAIEESRQGASLEIPDKIGNLTVSRLGLDLDHGTMIYGTDGFLSRRVKSVKIPSSVTSIGYGMLGDSLKSISYPEGIEEISSTSRFGGTPIAKVSLPKSLKSIGAVAFANSYSKKLSIPASVENIGFGAFMGSNFRSMTIPGSAAKLGDFLFASSALSSITLKEGVSEITKGMFLGCKYLSKISIPETVKSIGDYAFQDCSKLSEVRFKAGSISSIPYAAFRRCVALKQISIPSGVSEINADAFYGCSKLSKVTLPESISLIGEDAFSACSAKIVFVAKEGSFAYNWAIENGFKVKTK